VVADGMAVRVDEGSLGLQAEKTNENINRQTQETIFLVFILRSERIKNCEDLYKPTQLSER
jgi:hypothetical protein